MDKLIVKEKDELYNYLRKNLNKSKNNIKSLLKNECIYVNDKMITKYNYIVNTNDIITIGKYIKENTFDLKIIYEDENIIIIDKPTKILTISNDKEKNKTLYREVSNYLKKENKKVFVIHRLDYDTSGVIMFAKNKEVQELYQSKWNELTKIREYIAVVEGRTNSKGHIESYLKMSKSLQVYSSKNKDGLFSITDYERITYNDKYSLLRILISTGRRNQIRCHMSDIGHPILGDTRYKSKTNPLNRLTLHASLLEITNPLNNKVMTFKSNIPKEFYEITK